MRMVSWGKRLFLLGIVCLVCVQFVQFFGSYCPEWICNENTVTDGLMALEHNKKQPWFGEEKSRITRFHSAKNVPGKADKTILGRYRDDGISLWHANGSLKRLAVDFALNNSDVLVFLHIQKTGGTAFGKNMVQNLVDPVNGNRTCACKAGLKRCKCHRPSNKSKEWLFSRFSTGWKCGLHADWTELTNCVDQVLDQTEGFPEKRSWDQGEICTLSLPDGGLIKWKSDLSGGCQRVGKWENDLDRYFYMTLLRNPYRRYLSEFLHVQRGATWKNSRHWCGGRYASYAEIHPCFEGDTWEGVTMDEFLDCPDNLAVNRQTRMLADLERVGCYGKNSVPESERNAVILASARSNLMKMAFFGIVEQIEDTQFLFEHTFGLRFAEKLNSSYGARGENYTLTPHQHQLFMQRIALDVQLYEFAVGVFRQRLDAIRNGTYTVRQ